MSGAEIIQSLQKISDYRLNSNTEIKEDQEMMNMDKLSNSISTGKKTKKHRNKMNSLDLT